MYKNILVPVVLDEQKDNQSAYLIARALADGATKFTVVHVMETIPGYVKAEIPDSVLTNTRRECEKSLVKSAQALPGAVPKLISGNAGRAIVDYSNENDIDCIIMASHRPGGIIDHLLGSTAARVVRHAKCAVHVLR
jgi:universal stress protein F